NQLSYNCILELAPKRGVPSGAETRCNAPFWQGRDGVRKYEIFNAKARATGPGHAQLESPADQAAGL
ncbi:MAG: hypothetical protein ACREDY_26185, partial [Bradyrhizobium sp.]